MSFPWTRGTQRGRRRRPMAARIRCPTASKFLGLRECSQIASTIQPPRRSLARVWASRRRLELILSRQYDVACRRAGECHGHPCQKQPSTNRANRSCGKMKSGRILREGVVPVDGTRIETWRLHPLTFAVLRTLTITSSVELFPFPRIRDIRWLRSDFERVSICWVSWGGPFS